jgi:hypothetical protein
METLGAGERPRVGDRDQVSWATRAHRDDSHQSRSPSIEPALRFNAILSRKPWWRFW